MIHTVQHSIDHSLQFFFLNLNGTEIGDRSIWPYNGIHLPGEKKVTWLVVPLPT